MATGRNRRIESPFLIDNQPGTAAEGQERPGPLEHDQQAVAKAGQVVDVNHEPDQPGDEAAKPDAADLGDGAAAADGGHLSLVEEMELAAGLPTQLAQDASGDEPAFLHGHGGRAG